MSQTSAEALWAEREQLDAAPAADRLAAGLCLAGCGRAGNMALGDGPIVCNSCHADTQAWCALMGIVPSEEGLMRDHVLSYRSFATIDPATLRGDRALEWQRMMNQIRGR